MATLTAPTPKQSTQPNLSNTQAIGSAGFDWLMVALSLWTTAGLYLDGWAHNHLGNLETFFTPWHGILYSGFLVHTAVLAGWFVRNLRRGYSPAQALPYGYGLSLIGAIIFSVGGVGDLIWHTLFGIEVDVEALLSPTHLLLALGGALLATGPLRAGLRRSAQSIAERLPMVFSATALLSLLTFFSEYVSPFGASWVTALDRPSPNNLFVIQTIGITGFLFQSALLVGVVLILLRNNPLPPGALTLMLTLNVALMVTMHDIYLAIPPALLYLVGAVAGVGGDLLHGWLKPSITRPRELRLFAFALPAGLYALYFIAAGVTVGLWWSIHLWTGVIVLCGVMGWLVSYLVVPSSFEPVSLRPE